MNLPKIKTDDITFDIKRKRELIEVPCPGCAMCSRIIQMDSQSPDEHPWTCEAFPDGIPASLAIHENRHDEPYPGDSGKLYEPKLIKGHDQKVGVYFDWDGNAFDAQTLKLLLYEGDRR